MTILSKIKCLFHSSILISDVTCNVLSSYDHVSLLRRREPRQEIEQMCVCNFFSSLP